MRRQPTARKIPGPVGFFCAEQETLIRAAMPAVTLAVCHDRICLSSIKLPNIRDDFRAIPFPAADNASQ